MNNTDFRRMLQSTPRPDNASNPTTFAKPALPTASLGSRKTSSIPMTPRTVRGGHSISFAQQVADHNAGDAPRKRFKATNTPKGVKLGDGYSDRAVQRAQGELEDEREGRIKALEEQMKLGQISVQTFESLRDQITGGDVGATHLVKGLDRQLLKRVREGEDVLKDAEDVKKGEEEETPEGNPEDELEQLETAEVAPVQREDIKKKGEMAPPLAPKPVAGVKRSRADILAELKASRKAAEEVQAANQLGSRFKRFDPKRVEPRIERDEKGREVLITVDEHGRIKRKVRALPQADAKREQLLMPDKAIAPLGMVVPDVPVVPMGEEDDDIFEGAGDTYDPLGPALDDDDDSSSEDGEPPPDKERSEVDDVETPNDEPPTQEADQPKPELESAPKQNYFNERSPSPEATKTNNTAILESIKRAAAHAEASEKATQAQTKPEESSAAAKRLFQRDRDLDDMDMGFGDSRFGDEEEEDGGKIKLSNWKGMAGDDEDEEEGTSKDRGGKERKRGKKKKKGDKNSVADVLSVIQGRKK